MYNVRILPKFCVSTRGYKTFNLLECLRPLHHQCVYQLSSVRFISHHPRRYLDVEDKYKQTDGMTRDWSLIYKAPLEKHFKCATTFLTVVSSATVLFSLYYLGFKFSLDIIENPIIFKDIVIADDLKQGLILYVSLLLFLVSTKIVFSKIVIRLYKNGDHYVAIYRGHWYNKILKHEFRLNQFVPLRPTYFVGWGEARFGLGNRQGLLFERYFKTPEYFNYLLYKKKLKGCSENLE